MKANLIHDRILGSLYGGAVGDALGYPIEFLSYSKIISKFEPSGIRNFILNKYGVAEISDDTQMTLFTANGLLFGLTRIAVHGGLGASLADYIKEAYVEWYRLQKGTFKKSDFHLCWIDTFPGLDAWRAPGETCLHALRNIGKGWTVKNDSKGCGGIMRIAPIALIQSNFSPDYVARLAGDVAEITHKHPLGFLSAALTAYLIHQLLTAENVDDVLIQKIALEGVEVLHKIYPDLSYQIGLLKDIVFKAARLAVSSCPDSELCRLGRGWVAEETFAIALFCAFRHHHDFDKAVCAAVNHSGDSDSTGAVTGNIVGAIVGYSGIPERFKSNLELAPIIKILASDLLHPLPFDEKAKKDWFDKYVYITPPTI